jgi:undecaprenyl diphosphate synthase
MSASARYVAIIMDGNRRWTARHGLPVIDGHRAGAETVRARLRDALELGIEELAVYALPSKSFSPPGEEVAALMEIFGDQVIPEALELREEGVRIRFIGRRMGVAAELVERMAWAESQTAANKRITLFVAFNYRGRAEILDAARGFKAGGEEAFRIRLYAPEMHDPDLLIRTGGQRRLSNYLLWQCAYSELVFRDELWPDFGRAALQECLEEFSARQRRYGARL